MSEKRFAFYKVLLSVLIVILVLSCPAKKENTGGENKKKVELNKSELFLQVGFFQMLQANIENVKWKSADSSIAKVENGKVIAVSVGETVVRAILGDEVALCKVRVGNIKIEKEEYSVREEKVVQIVAEVSLPQDKGDKTIAWKSEGEDIATVDAEGKVTGVKVGKTQIVATSNGMQAKCSVKVTEKELAFEVKVTNINGANADFSIKPNKSDVVYAFGIMTKAKYVRQKNLGDTQNPPVGVFVFDKQKYKNMQDASGGAWKSWQEAAKAANFYRTGEQTGKVVGGAFIDIEDARPDVECVLYYYLIKESDAVPQSEIFTEEFKFALQSKSDNKVTCEIKETYINGVKAEFKTTNADSYFVAICKESQVKWYTEGGGKAQGKTLKDLAYKLVATASGIHVFSGDKMITPKEMQTEENVEGSVAYLVWFVYDTEHGVRQDVSLKSFVTSNTIWQD